MKTKALNNTAFALCTVLFVLCIANSEAVIEQSRYYLRLCAVNVVPSLFVFSVLCGVICSGSAFYRLCALPLFGTEAAVLTIGLLGGFPLGADVSCRLYENGAVTKKQAQYLCAFTNTPSLSFTVGLVGSVLGSKRLGLLLFLLVVASALLTAIVLKLFYLKDGERDIRINPLFCKPKSLPQVIKDSCISMISVSGCIVFFGSIAVLFPRNVSGFFEISGGVCDSRSVTQAAILLGFSGLSVMMQISAVCGGRISSFPFVLSKLFQSAFMGAAAYFLLDK